MVGAHEFVDQSLHFSHERRRRLAPFSRRRPIVVAGADDEADPILMAVDREFILQRQPAALLPDVGQLGFARRT